MARDLGGRRGPGLASSSSKPSLAATCCPHCLAPAPVASSVAASVVVAEPRCCSPGRSLSGHG